MLPKLHHHGTRSLFEKYRDPGRGRLGRLSRILALAKFSLSKIRTHVVSNLLYSSTQNCTKTIHSSKLYTQEPPPLLLLITIPKKIYKNPDIYKELSPQQQWLSREQSPTKTSPTHPNRYIKWNSPPAQSACCPVETRMSLDPISADLAVPLQTKRRN